MFCHDLDTLRSLDLPEIPEGFFQAGTFAKEYRSIPVGTIVTLQKEYYRRWSHNPERVWGYVEDFSSGTCFVRWSTGVRNDYRGGCLCTLEEFMLEYGNALPFSWRS